MSEQQHKQRTTKSSSTKAVPRPQPKVAPPQVLRPQTLRPGDTVLGSDGGVIFRVDPEKKRASDMALRAALRSAASSRPLEPSKKSERTKKAIKRTTEELEARRRRGVVKHDWGLARRDERVAKRTAVLQKRTARRRHNRAKRRATRHRPTIADSWDAVGTTNAAASTTDPATTSSVQTESSEGWWGPVLDGAIELGKHIIPLVAGMGDYELDEPVNQEMPRSNSLAAAFSDGEMCAEVPAVHSLGSETRFTHREYIGDVYSSNAAFSKIEFDINPGLPGAFPWVSRCASNYEQYSLQGMLMEFVTEASNYSSTPGLGYVALGSQYDVAEPEFTNKKEMFQSIFSVARAPSKSFCHWIECNPDVLVLPKKFIREGDVPPDADVHLYDHCRTTLAVGGQGTPGVIIGELWNTYDLLCFLPRTDETKGGSLKYAAFQSALGTVSQGTPLGTGWVPSTRNTFSAVLQNLSITLPQYTSAGDYELQIFWGGSGASGVYRIADYTFQNCVVIAGTQQIAGQGTAYATTGTGPTGMMLSVYFTVTQSGATPIITFTNNQWVGPSGGTATIIITQIPKIQSMPSPIFDPLGLEAEARYDNMRRVLDPTLRDVPERSTHSFSLVTADSQWFIVPNGADTRVRITEETAKSLSLVSDKLFDLMALELCSPTERASARSG